MLLTNSLLFILHILSNNYLNYDDEEFIKLDLKDAYFSDVDWILNFDEVKDCTNNEIILKCNKIIQQRNYIADKYNSFSTKDRIKHINMLIKSNDLEYKINSYKDILAIKKGEKKIKLPDGIEFPEGFIKTPPVKKIMKIFKK